MEVPKEYRKLIARTMADIAAALLVTARSVEALHAEMPNRRPPTRRAVRGVPRGAKVVQMPQLAIGA